VRLGSGTSAAGEAVRRLFALSDSAPGDGGPLDLREVDLCIDQWHLIDGDRMALDLVFTPPLGRDNFVLLPGHGTSLVRDDLPRERIDEPVRFLGGPAITITGCSTPCRGWRLPVMASRRGPET